MKKIIAGGLGAILFAGASHRAAAQSAPQQPKLVIAIIVDQFRYDYTTRFRARYSACLAKMLSQGAVFLDAHQDHFPTVTATGHAGFMSGAVPATSGIIANDWYDRASGKTITSVEDSNTKLLGVPGDNEGSSPHNLAVSTLGDEIKIADRGTSKVIGISMKDRAAILPSGRMADAAYWVDGGVYLNNDLISQKKLKHSAVEDVVASTLIQLPYVERVYTRTELLKHEAGQSQIDSYMASAFFAQRSADVLATFLPYYLFGKSGTSHGSPFNYDSHVPLIFYGAGVRPGMYAQQVGISDVAPTLAAILHVETPSGSVGHILEQLIQPSASLVSSHPSSTHKTQ
jgi:hypothetical protein